MRLIGMPPTNPPDVAHLTAESLPDDVATLQHLVLELLDSLRQQQRDSVADTLVPVQLVPDDEPSGPSTFEVVLAGGRTLRVASGFDAATLRQLLAVLEEVRSC